MMRTAKVGAIDDSVWTDGDKSVATTSRHRGRRALTVVLVTSVGLSTVYVSVAMALSRWKFGTTSFWKSPVRMDYCGRRYNQDSSTVPGTPASLTAPYKAALVQWKEVERTFSLQPIYADVLTSHPNSAVCAFFCLFRRATNDGGRTG